MTSLLMLLHCNSGPLQAIDELQAVVEGRCIKTDQLGEIFAARDNMYGAWQRMQAVFEANRSSSEAGAPALGSRLFKIRPSSTLSRAPSTSEIIMATHAAAAAAAAATAADVSAVALAAPRLLDAVDAVRQGDSWLGSLGLQSPAVAAACSTTAQVVEQSAVGTAATQAAAAATRGTPEEQRHHDALVERTSSDVLPAVPWQNIPEEIALVHIEPPGHASEPLLAAEPVANSSTADLEAASNSPQVNHEVSASADQLNTAHKHDRHRISEEELLELRGRLLLLEGQMQICMAATESAASATSVVAEQLVAADALQALTERVAEMQQQHMVLVQQIEQQHTCPTLAALAADVRQLQKQYTTIQENIQQQSSTMLSALLSEAQERQEALQQQALALQQHSMPTPQPAPTEQDCDADEESEDEFHSPRTNASFSTAPAVSAGSSGVLHAPLSLVVQLQQELAALRDGQVSKEQFAVLSRMMKDGRGNGSHSGCASPAATADGIPGPSLAAGAFGAATNLTGSAAAAGACSANTAGSSTAITTSQELQKHSDRLQAMECSVHTLMVERLQTAESVAALQLVVDDMCVKQQHALGALDEQLSDLAEKVDQVADRHAAAEQQLSAITARCTAIEPQAQQLLAQHATLQADLAALSVAFNDLAAKVATPALAQKQQWQGTEPVAGGFNELVTALAKLKGCYDQQAVNMTDLQDKVDSQEAIVAELADAVQARTAAVAVGMDEGFSTSNGSSHRQSMPDAAAHQDLRSQLEIVTVDLKALKEQLLQIMQYIELLQMQSSAESCAPQKAANAALPVHVVGALDAPTTDVMLSATDNSAADAAKVTAISAACNGEEAPVAALYGVDSTLKELVERVRKLEVQSAAATSPGTAAAAAGTANINGRNTNARRGAAWLSPLGESATLAELQVLVEKLQLEVAAISAESASHAGMLSALRGDVGAAAAAAAAAAALAVPHKAASTPLEAAVAGDAGTGCSRVNDGATSSSVAASAASDAMHTACQAQASATTAHAGLTTVAQDLQQLRLIVEQLLLEQPVKETNAEEPAMMQSQHAPSDAEAAKACDNDSAHLKMLALIKKELDPLQERVAGWAADAALTAVAGVTDLLQAQLLEVQQQMSGANACLTGAAGPPFAGLEPARLSNQTAHATEAACSEATSASEEIVTRDRSALDTASDGPSGPVDPGSGVGASALLPSLSFSDLSLTQSEKALTKQLWSTVAAGIAEGNMNDLTASNSSWFEHAFDAVDAQQTEQQHHAIPWREEPIINCCREGLAGSAAVEDTSSKATTAPAFGGAVAAQEALAGQLSMMSPVQQVAFLSKLTAVVSAHASRLLTTYEADPEHSQQLRQVQQRLALTAAQLGNAVSAPSTTSGAASRYARSSSMGLSMMNATASVAAGGAGDLLLSILDQVAALRAIGSATHPAITQALQRHDDQLAAIMLALDRHGVVQQNTGEAAGGAIMNATAAGDAIAPITLSPSTPAAVLPVAPAADSDVTGPIAANVAGEAFSGEYGQRLSALEIKLSSGLKVLSGLRTRLAPLQEVADATQSMLRELQVAHGLVLQRLESLEGLAATVASGTGTTAGVDSASAEGDVLDATSTRPALLTVAGSVRAMKVGWWYVAARCNSWPAGIHPQHWHWRVCLQRLIDCLEMPRLLRALNDCLGESAVLVVLLFQGLQSTVTSLEMTWCAEARL
jgi:NTP pyrophosphatase (non-canonical NTP hydrolase)